MSAEQRPTVTIRILLSDYHRLRMLSKDASFTQMITSLLDWHLGNTAVPVEEPEKADGGRD